MSSRALPFSSQASFHFFVWWFFWFPLTFSIPQMWICDLIIFHLISWLHLTRNISKWRNSVILGTAVHCRPAEANFEVNQASSFLHFKPTLKCLHLKFSNFCKILQSFVAYFWQMTILRLAILLLCLSDRDSVHIEWDIWVRVRLSEILFSVFGLMRKKN